MYGANRWECNVTSGVLHVVRKTAAARVAVLPVDFQRSTCTCLLSRVSHVTFPAVVTVSIVRGSILFVLMNPC